MNYPYAVGNVKAVESRIFDKSKFSKLIRVEKSDFLKTLKELGYASSVNSDNLEDLINQELVALKQYFDEISPNQRLTDLFFMANDATNIKIIFKKRIFKIDQIDAYSNTGSISPEILEKAIMNQDYSLLSKEIQTLLLEIEKQIDGLTSARFISSKIDNAIYDYVFNENSFSQAKALKSYFQAVIDTTNIMSWLRCRLLEWDVSELETMFINHGLIAKTLFLESFSMSKETAPRVFMDYYKEKIMKALKAYFERPRLNQMEKQLDLLVLELMKEERNDSFSIGPIIYYYLQKISEAKNIRMIYASTYFDPNDLLDY
ncbi:MAG: V-type ATPase subunit [Bacilli bacterium]